MKKIWRRGIPFSPEVAPLVARMPVVDEYRESLLRLQGVWDSLSMLGQMSGTLPDIGATRSAFQALTEKLLDSLGRCLLTNLVQRMRNQGQVAIDILVRNLFERTADIGFLATDTALRDFMQACAGSATPDADLRQRLEARFADYAAKYSVYDDIIVLASDGRVLARLDASINANSCHEPWLGEALGGAPYVERFGASPVMGGRVSLLYATGIRVGSRVEGALCLSFKFDGEMRGVFQQLLSADDPAVIALVDAAGQVLASSDRWQLPLGATLPGAAAAGSAAPSHHHLRFAGREYLCVSALATGYEGYQGPGWSARVIVPIDHAFTQQDDSTEATSAPDALTGHIDTRQLFTEDLRSIPQEALRIQRDLSRVLWNGKLQPRVEGASQAFTATLLREVGLTGDRIRQVFDQATDNLQSSTLSAVFDQARHHARLAIDIMDRNLYERANDCRWWALDGVLRQTLAQPADQRDADAAAAVLRRINGLYTVYALLVLFDTQGRVVAVSDPAASAWQGRLLDAPWVRQTLALRDAQSYAASRHQPSALYADRATCVFAAAVRTPDAAHVSGGIAIVFDGAPQFEAMLHDALPQNGESQSPGSAFSLLVTRSGTVVASSDARWPVGSAAALPPGLPALPRGAAETAVLDIDGIAYAAGYSMSGGYREYRSAEAGAPDDVAALVLLRLGPQRARPGAATAAIDVPPITKRLANQTLLSIASFISDGQWLGLPAAATLQAMQRPRIAAIPNAPAHLLGMTLFEGQLLPVVDVAQLRSQRASSDVDAPVIVLQGPGGHRFALRVDELGPVFDVPESELQPVNNSMRGDTGEKLVSSNQQMLILLDMDQLMLSAGVVKAGSAVPA
ncbi:MAG TPA: chemotaxis protein CheW [Rhizobacter sp.]|nr:chemotaxis protein CheW [Rhizobacter sp.]